MLRCWKVWECAQYFVSTKPKRQTKTYNKELCRSPRQFPLLTIEKYQAQVSISRRNWNRTSGEDVQCLSARTKWAVLLQCCRTASGSAVNPLWSGWMQQSQILAAKCCQEQPFNCFKQWFDSGTDIFRNHNQRCGKAVNGLQICQECVYEISVYSISEAIRSALAAVRKTHKIVIVIAWWLLIGFKNLKNVDIEYDIARNWRLFNCMLQMVKKMIHYVDAY